MNQLVQTFLIFVVGLLGGLIGSVLFSDGSSSGAADTADGSGYSASGETELNDTLEALQARIDTLSISVEQQQSAILTLQDQVAGAIEMDRALREGTLPGGDPIPQGLAMGDMPTGPGFDAAVDAVIQQREDQEAADRAARREERRVEQLERRVEDLAEQLGLDEGQKSEFAKILDESSKARNDFFQEMREGGFPDRDLIREKMGEMRESELETLGGLLNSEQMTQYEELTSGGGFGGRGFGGGGGGGNRGGNNGGGNSGGGRDF